MLSLFWSEHTVLSSLSSYGIQVFRSGGSVGRAKDFAVALYWLTWEINTSELVWDRI